MQRRRVAAGATIDFRQDGCTLSINAPPERFTAHVEFENPDADALTYDWQTMVTVAGAESTINSSLGSTSATFTPYSPGNSIDVTNDCRITVTVHAPDPTRSKTLTVWTGKCTYWATYIG